MKVKFVLACQSRYPTPSPRCIGQPDDSRSQYYIIATGTILFYDYLLTLADEVRRYASRISVLTPLSEDQVCLVWEEIVEYVQR